MAYRLLDHTADLALEVTAPTREGVFAEAAAGLCDCLVDRESVRERAERTVVAVAAAGDLLLVEWLGEILHLFEMEAFLVRRADVVLAPPPGFGVDGTLHGEVFDPARHESRVAIKGVTYHALDFGRHGEGFRALVILDI